jgi:hypothetical protein
VPIVSSSLAWSFAPTTTYTTRYSVRLELTVQRSAIGNPALGATVLAAALPTGTITGTVVGAANTGPCCGLQSSVSERQRRAAAEQSRRTEQLAPSRLTRLILLAHLFRFVCPSSLVCLCRLQQ